MPVSVTMRPIQCGSSPEVTQTKPGLWLCFVYVFVHVHMFERIEAERRCGEKERKGEKEHVRVYEEQESKQIERVRESAAQGQDGVILNGRQSRVAERTDKQSL